MSIDFYSIRRFEDITEFHCIMPIENISSILKFGILSHEEAEKRTHKSVAMDIIQDIRKGKKVPGGLQLHQYANLYFHARNPMLFKRKNKKICVLRIDKKVVNILDVVFTDRNAASAYVKFLSLREIRFLDYKKIYAKDWCDIDYESPLYYEKKSKKLAEILVPNKIGFEYIIGAYVKNSTDKNYLQNLGFNKSVTLNKELFFL